jgi:hypothetical protein
VTFYTYTWLRDDGTPYYIGWGTGTRPWDSCKGHRPPKDPAHIIVQEWPCAGDAKLAEIFLIAYYGRKDNGTGILRNMTDGGEGQTGYKFSEASRLKMSRRNKGIKNLAHCLQMAEKRRGKPPWNLGLPGTFTGRKHTSEAMAKMRMPRIRVPWNKGNLGISTLSEEHKRNIGAGVRKFRERNTTCQQQT